MAPVIHHMNCGTMCPHAGVRLALVPSDPGHIVCHCLLIEAADGLVLVDTGYGTGDIAAPKRLGPARLLLNAKLDREETAVARVRALGHDPADVRHVLATHLDLDHAGGLGDFPNAEVHVHSTELAAARAPKRDAKLRYRTAQWAHGPRWAAHDAVDGEPWFGFPRVRLLEGAGVEIAMIPLHGHTSGHTGVAVDTGDGWLLHAGDAYLDHGEIASPPRRGRALTAYHRVNSVDEALRRTNVERLAELARDPAVSVFCAHDPLELRRLG
ncbi:MAG: MBL fold metallo-hydrolase [Solirubrobacterales bacterium]|nr:MBL fold metallo-hydrolase [Solirubrobacterales bacterium]